MKILVLGNKGMLGHVTELYLKEGYDVTGWNREHFDARNYGVAERLSIEINSYDIIINCVGILNRDTDKELYADVNICFPRMLAKLCDLYGGKKLIHISTNCVFENIGPHFQNSTPDAKDLYGYSKWMGEPMGHYVIRTSIIGPELKDGIGLFHKFLTDENFYHGYKNVFWNGVTTLELAKFIEEKIISTDSLNEPEIGEAIHFHTANPISKFQLLREINAVFNLDRILVPVYKEAHQSLLNGHPAPIDYLEQLTQLKSFMKKHEKLYKNYRVR